MKHLLSCTIITVLSFGCVTLANESTELAISKSLEVHSKKESVWSALTNEHELRQWWGEGVKLEPRIGGIFYEPWGNGQLATGQVVHLEPEKHITFTWQEAYWQGSGITTCSFSLREFPGGTILDINHFGWESFRDPKNGVELMEGFKKGWDLLLPKLKKYLEEKNKHNRKSE